MYAEHGQQAFQTSVYFIYVAVVKYPSKSDLRGERTYFGSQFQRGSVHHGRVEMVTEA